MARARSRALARLSVVTALLPLTACAVRLGGPGPEEYRVVALLASEQTSPASVSAQIRGAGADIAFLMGAADTNWLAQVAGGSGLQLSGPALGGGSGASFLAGEAVGDTTVSLPVEAGALVIQDALYKIDDDRYLDLMALHLPAGVEPRAAARALLGYIATDVMKEAAVILTISSDSPGELVQLTSRLQPAFVGAASCGESHSAAEALPIQMLYGPALRVRCGWLRELTGSSPGVVANMVVRR